jgi:hypothetical protein
LIDHVYRRELFSYERSNGQALERKRKGKGREILKGIFIVAQHTVDYYFSPFNDLSGGDSHK